MGGGELTYGTMRDYAACGGPLAEPWEFDTLNAMKRAYNGEYGKTDPLRIPPIERPEDYA